MDSLNPLCQQVWMAEVTESLVKGHVCATTTWSSLSAMKTAAAASDDKKSLRHFFGMQPFSSRLTPYGSFTVLSIVAFRR